MVDRDRFRPLRVSSEEQRLRALEVVGDVYLREKGWVSDPDKVFPRSDLDNPVVSWHLVEEHGEPVGALRVLYDLPIELYREYAFDLIDADLDVEAFLRHNRVAEIGRFAVRADRRSSFLVAAMLIRETTLETVQRGFTHYVTDVFEGEEHSPYGFHQRVLGFRTVATHRHGELDCDYRRLTMLLDLNEAFRTAREKNTWIYRFVTDGWDPELIDRLCA